MDRPEDTYVRRISAVLVADVSGFSALMGEDDERTARDVRRMQALVQAIVADLQGRAEPQAGDSIFASFASVVAAVEAAIRIQRRLADESEPARPLRLRIGVHFGDVLLLPEGSAVGDAINVAARLCALARPGTVCISEGVYRHVRARFDEPVEDLGRQRLKNISDPVHAYLIVPRDTGAARRRRRMMPWGIAAAASAMLALGMWLWLPGSRHPAAERAAIVPAPGATFPAAVPESVTADDQPDVTLGVMLFKSHGGEGETGWMREALRDGLNAQLSGLSRVKVYSKEFIDFLISREGLSEIEAASKLGITKMLSGSFVAVAGKLRIETHVVDVRTGVLQTSVTTVGTADHFLELQTGMVEDVIARLDLPVTEDERRTLLARRSTDVDALKLLLEAEGGGGEAGAIGPPEPRSSLLRWLASAASPVPAWADDRNDILAVLEQYRQATEAREMQTVAAVYIEFTPEQQAAQQRYFDNVKDLKVVLDDVDVAVVGDEAIASYTRTDDFADARTGRPMHVSLRLTKQLKRTPQGWRLAGAK